MIEGRRHALMLLALIALGVLGWMLLRDDVRPGTEPPRPVPGPVVRKEPHLRGAPRPASPPSTIEDDDASPHDDRAAHDPAPDAPAWTLEVRTYDGDGRLLGSESLPGGSVYVDVRLRFVSEGDHPRVQGHPDEDGVARLEVRGGGRLCAFAPAPWQPYVSDVLQPPERGLRALDIELDEGLDITGMVLDHEGEPVGDMKVVARPVAPPPWGERTPSWLWWAFSDAEGSFRIQGLGPGRYRVEAKNPWIVGEESPGRPPPPQEAAAGTDGVVLAFLPPTRYTLSFVHEGSGKAARVSAQVYVLDGPSRRWMASVSTSTSCPVDPAPAPGQSVRVEAEGYFPHDVPHSVFLDDADDRIIQVPLRADVGSMVPVVLHLRDAAGRPIPSIDLARRMTQGPDPDGGTWVGKTLACPDGRIEQRFGVGRQELKLTAPSFNPLAGDRSSPSWLRLLLQTRVTLELARGRPHEETVVMPSGGAVRVHDPQALHFGFLLRDKQGAMVPGQMNTQAHMDFSREVFPIPPGEWQLVYLIDGKEIPVDIRVIAGEVTEVPWDPRRLER